MKTHSHVEKRTASAQQDAQQDAQRPGRTTAAYWETRLTRPTSANGTASPDFSVQIQHAGQRHRFPLKTANARAASSLAVAIFKHIVRHGWESALVTYKGESADKRPHATVGDVIREARALSDARPQSLAAYEKALRAIAADIAGMPQDSARYQTKSAENGEWRATVDRIRIDRLTPQAVRKWRNARLAEVTDPEAKARTGRTLNSLVRNAKALFARKFLPDLRRTLALPEALPFEELKALDENDDFFRSTVDIFTIIESARHELAERSPEAFKVFLLTAVCGLRRSEADRLLWDQFDFTDPQRPRLEVRTTDAHELKSKKNRRTVALDLELAAIFRGFLARATGRFVVEGDAGVIVNDAARRYRAEAAHQQLLAWLRSQGVTDAKPIHAMRKQCGSIVATSHGIFAASRMLGHSDIRTTSRHYADQLEAVVVPLTRPITGAGA